MTYYFFDWGIHLELWKAKYQISSEPNIGVLGFSNFDVHTSSLPCRLYFFQMAQHEISLHILFL